MPVLTRRPAPAPRTRATFRRPRGLTASAERADAAAATGGLVRLAQQWQWDAMRVYRTMGECWNPAQYYSRAMERIRYFPAVRDERGVAVESTDPKLVALFNRIQTPSGSPGDLSELAGPYARLHFAIGDGLLVVSDDDGEEVWEYLSPMELRLNPSGDRKDPQSYRRLRAPNALPEELIEAPDNDFEPIGGKRARVWRLWRRHPEYSAWADSPVRPVLDLYQTLNRLTLAVAAEASSRAAQRGLLFIPDEFSIGPVDTTQEENPDDDPLIREFVESMMRAIRDPGSAEAMQPFIIRAPGVTNVAGGSIPTADLIKWIQLGPQDRYTEGEMWDKTISRIAGSIDMPKELMTGVGDVSHWGQWFLDDIGFRQHTGPTVERFCRDVAAAYLRPAAVAARIKDADRVTVGFDPSSAINHPDETGVWRDAHDRLVVSDKSYRGKIGASDDDKPNPEELKRRTEIKLKEDPYQQATSSKRPPEKDGETQPVDGGRGGDVKQEPPTDSQTRPSGKAPPSPDGPSLSSMVIGAALMQVDRARELAGNKVIRYAQTCGECQDAIKDVPVPLVASALGPVQVRALIEGRKTEAELIAGVGDAFARRLRAWDIDGGWPEQLGQMVEQHVIRTLYEREVPAFPPVFLQACRKACG